MGLGCSVGASDLGGGRASVLVGASYTHRRPQQVEYELSGYVGMHEKMVTTGPNSRDVVQLGWSILVWVITLWV